jgi:formylmethanofuran dehydrogenase subunit C
MPVLLEPLADVAAPPLSIDVTGIVPDRLCGLSPAAIARLPIEVDGGGCELGDVFAVSGDPADGRLDCRGDFSRVHGVAAGMRWGHVDVEGNVGRHAAARMSGGTLTVSGSAGDWLAVEMAGGDVRVRGSAGDNAAAALPGSDLGMRGGLVIIQGDVGGLAGARMRRGILAVGGGCGAAPAFEMRAGTVLVAGRVGGQPGLGMRRGSIIALTAATAVPPTFLRGGLWLPPFLPFLLRRLADAGFRPKAGGGPWRQWHGDTLAGGRGEILQPEGPAAA